MADFSLQDFWWNKPPRTESALPALQLGIQMVQRRAQEDLQERQLASELARTEIAREESIAKLQLQNSISAANAGLAKLASQIKDWSDPVEMKPIYDWGALNGSAVGTKGWEGIINTHERAVAAKRMGENTQSLIESRKDRAKLNALIEARRALLANSTIDLNDARITKYDKDIAFEERRLLLGEGNLKARNEELELKQNRFNEDKWTSEDKIEYNRRSKIIEANEKLTAEDKDLAIQEIREDIEGKRQQREGFKEKKAEREGLKTEDRTTNAPPAVVAPVDDNVVRQGGSLFQQQPDGTWKFIGPAQ